MSERAQAITALTLSTIAFTACFASWVLNGVLIPFLGAAGAYRFTDTEVGWLLAAPLCTGALSRLPMGILTDRYGGRIVMPLLIAATALSMFLLSLADDYQGFLLASLGFGLAGGSFAVGVAHVSPWFESARQGTALGIFGVGNAGAAITTLLAPQLIAWATDGGRVVDGWRLVPRLYSAGLVAVAILFYVATRSRRAATSPALAEQLAPLRNVVVWRLGFYYSLVFGAFIALAQWIIPYGVSVYQLSVAKAGILAAVFSLPGGVIRAAGGWLSDRFGARAVMYGVFGGCIASCLILSVPKMDIRSPGEGIPATKAGSVAAVSAPAITVGDGVYRLLPPPEHTPAELDRGSRVFPHIAAWHEPVVRVGDAVEKKQLLARGVTNIYYPANLWVFAGLLFVVGAATGVGKAAVYKLIPEQFPGAVGTVGGTVALIGGLGGFMYPALFGYLLRWTGLWTSCWMFLAVVSVACLLSMHGVVRRMMREEVPELVRLIERRPALVLGRAIHLAGRAPAPTVEALLKNVPFFADLTSEQLKELARVGRWVAVGADRNVFREGDPADNLYVLLGGTVRVCRTDERGQTVELATLAEGDFFGELALIDGAPRSATVRTAAPCEFFVIARRDFLTAAAKSTGMVANLLVGLSAKLRRSNAEHFELVLNRERLRSRMEIERHRSIAQMVAGLAHEINTPLGIVNQAASVITDLLGPDASAAPDTDGPGRARRNDLVEAASLIQANIARAATLVRSFKELSVRQMTDGREKVDLRRLTTDVVGLYRLKARASKLDVRIKDDLGEGAAEWLGYPGYYSQILLNLITNVDRYAYPEGNGGTVEIGLSRGAGGATPRFTVVVRDFGRGIPPDDLPRLFDPFFTTGRASGGTGLGLAIVHNLATSALKGEVRIESEPGRGTVVILSFPAVIEEEEPDARK